MRALGIGREVGARAHMAIRLALACLVSVSVAGAAEAQTMWKNGRWFDGTKFIARTMYSTDLGQLSSRRPARITDTVDLRGGYVVPAYGDAHHHGIDGEAGLESKIAAFLRDGIFYVKNPNVIPDLLTPTVRAKLNRPDSIDVAFANGGLTGAGGHPGPLHDDLADRGVFPGLKRADMPGRGYFYVDDEQGLNKLWPTIMAGRPDFIKVYLNGGIRVARPNEDPGTKVGLSAQTLKAVVDRAHAAGLRVTAHIETGSDFAVAVRSGVDELGHMPHFGPRGAVNPAYLISSEDAAEAARRGVTVTPTASVLPRMHGEGWSEAQRAAVVATQKRNLDVLRAGGVKLAIGSDGISGEAPFATAKGEVEYLRESKLADPLELLRMWAVNTPQTIFPKRKVGALRDGYEANFLVLEADPLSDPANLYRIRTRVKAGKLLPSL